MSSEKSKWGMQREGESNGGVIKSIGEVGTLRAPAKKDFSKDIRTLKAATASDNATILTELRQIVKNQLNLLKNQSLGQLFTSGEANVMHKLAQTYAILDGHTEKEQRKYDYSGMSELDLAAATEEARAMLSK